MIELLNLLFVWAIKRKVWNHQTMKIPPGWSKKAGFRFPTAIILILVITVFLINGHWFIPYVHPVRLTYKWTLKSPRVRGPGPWRIEWSNDKISDWLIRFSFSSLLMSQEKIKSVKIENIEFYDAVWSVLFKYTVYWSCKWVTKLILSRLCIIPLWLILRGEINQHLRIFRQIVVILGFSGQIWSTRPYICHH